MKRLSDYYRNQVRKAGQFVKWGPIVIILALIIYGGYSARQNLLYYFQEYPKKVWWDFDWEINDICSEIKEMGDIEHFYLPPSVGYYRDISILFALRVKPEVWQKNKAFPRLTRGKFVAGIKNAAVICRDNAYENLPVTKTLYNPRHVSYMLSNPNI